MSFTRLRQVCTVVDDFDATVIRLTEHLGIGPFRCWHFRAPVLYDTTFRGRKSRWDMKLAITWLGDLQWEVITPMEGESLYREHLTTHGRGVQHLLMATSTPFEEATAELAAKGHPLDQTARLNPPLLLGRFTLPPAPRRFAGRANLHFGYLDLEESLRTSIELTRYPLGFSERFALRAGKPEYTVPAGKRDFERGLPGRRIDRVVKVTLLTRDLPATMAAWKDLAGVGRFHVFHEAGKERTAWCLLGETVIELVDPTSGDAHLASLLEERGECVASLGVTPRGSFEDLAAACDAFGYGRAPGKDPRRLYLFSRRALGTDLELLADPRDARDLFASRTPDRVV